MSKKIKVVAVVASAAALTGGIAVGASAASHVVKTSVTKVAITAPRSMNANGVARGPQATLATTLADLVKKGTITQAQADAITAAVNAAEAAEHANDDAMGKGPMGNGFAPNGTNKLNLIASTLGIDTATLLSKIQAGSSLATIAGDKKAALIAALVADETKQIDAAVTAGSLTAAQAATLKANLVAHITAEVEETPARIGGGMGGRGGHGGRGDHDGRGMMGGAAPTLPGSTTTKTVSA